MFPDKVHIPGRPLHMLFRKRFEIWIRLTAGVKKSYLLGHFNNQSVVRGDAHGLKEPMFLILSVRAAGSGRARRGGRSRKCARRAAR